MATTLFKDTTYSVFGLIEDIKQGEVALPDIQRPFVWGASKVRDLLDSMYKGFPVGYLLFWATGPSRGPPDRPGGEAEGAAPADRGRSAAADLAIRGDDRLQGRARTTTPRGASGSRSAPPTHVRRHRRCHREGPRVHPRHIRVVGPRRASRTWYAPTSKRLEAKRRADRGEKDRLEEAIDRVHDLRDYPFKAVELASTVDEEQVAEVFVRINSEGVTLNQADFILTLMSVFWEKGRQQLEDFSRGCKVPTLSGASPFNWYIQPSPAQMLRVSVALAFRRACSSTLHAAAWQGHRDRRSLDPSGGTQQFARLQQAHDDVLDLTNWHEFLQCLERAGFRGSKMISSENALLFSYALWLIGRVDYGVPLDRLREIIARWFFMAHTTGRYTGTFESRFEQDAARLTDLEPGDADGFIRTLSRIVETP